VQNKVQNYYVDYYNSTKDGKKLYIGTDQINLEQDTGKTITTTTNHHDHPNSQTSSYIDFNGAGSTFIEIFFLPQIHAAYEAASVVSTLQKLLRYLGTCDGKIEEGRCAVTYGFRIGWE